MTRMLVLSDTHLSQGSKESGSSFDLLEDLTGYIHAADLIIHAGDHTGLGFYHQLLDAGDLVSVAGNMDALPLQSELPERVVIEREGVRIGILHGWGPATGLENRIFDAWQNDKPDVMIFGHSHRVHQSWRNGFLLFNPGSPTHQRDSKPTAGWIEIDNGSVSARIIELPKKGEFP
jgi:putative phosphoesterase